VSAALQIIQIGLGSNTAFAQQATALLGAGASVGVLMPWGRAQESEADHLGLIYMAKAGYIPRPQRNFGLEWKRPPAPGKGLPSSCPPTRRRRPASSRSRGWMPETMTYYRPR
jgi:metalloendopeptidase OMA1, mitochondrial